MAESENFITVYPNGTGRLSGRLLTWNAGTCCAYSVINKVDDVGFVRVLVEKIAEKVPIDRRRIYATGMSNGGMMAHRLAAEASGMIAAVVPVAGGMVLPLVKSARAVPVLQIHSVDDPRALYSGGLGPPFPLTKKQVFHPNIDEMIKRWVDHNGCAVDGRKTLQESADRIQYSSRMAKSLPHDQIEQMQEENQVMDMVWRCCGKRSGHDDH